MRSVDAGNSPLSNIAYAFHFDAGLFAENFFPDYPIDSLKKQSIDLFTKAGKIIAVKEMKAENQLRGSFIVEGTNINMEIYFTLSPENPPLIQEYHIREIAKQK